MIKSPLRYPGGKSRAVELIGKLLPDFDEFREPFVGGGSVFIHTKQRFPLKTYWVNDLYTELYNFWHIAQTNIQELTSIIYTWKVRFPIGKDLYLFLKEHFSDFTAAEKAAAFFIFNRVTFSGTSLSGGFSEAAFTGRFTESSIERLQPFSQLLDNVKITNLDYESVVSEPGNNVFIFLDPPYYSATKSALYGKNGNLHTSFQHERFAETVKNCRHNWLITYDDSPFIRKLFSFAHIIPWNLVYGMRNVAQGSDQIGKELFISNYADILPEEQQLQLFSYSSSM